MYQDVVDDVVEILSMLETQDSLDSAVVDEDDDDDDDDEDGYRPEPSSIPRVWSQERLRRRSQQQQHSSSSIKCINPFVHSLRVIDNSAWLLFATDICFYFCVFDFACVKEDEEGGRRGEMEKSRSCPLPWPLRLFLNLNNPAPPPCSLLLKRLELIRSRN